MDYKYTFVPMGSTINSTEKENPLYPDRNRIILDVGNDLRSGIIDTHHLPGGVMVNQKQLKSAAAVLASYPFLLLDNIDSQAETIEIIVHASPDLDCFAAVYLAHNLIENGTLPPHAASLVDYVEQVDRGMVLINRNTISSPAAVACAIDEVLKSKNPQIGSSDLWEQSLLRGRDMIAYIMQRMEKMMPEERSLFHPALFAAQNPFQDEIKLLRKDYNQYLQERDNRALTEIKRIRIPAWTERDQELQEVDALFWKQPSQCVLHKHWARGDHEHSVDGKGFILTFIPVTKDPIDLSVKKLQLSSGDTELSLNRVIISVNPALSFHLKGLASTLEAAEHKREIELFGKNFDFKKWRSQDIRRFEDSHWCTNEDPWYDGRDSGFTIVDAPGTGSLLTIEEIKAITLGFTKPSLKSHHCKLVIPFEFSHRIYYDLVNWCRNNKQIRDSSDKELAHNFTKSVNKYLFSATEREDGLPHRLFIKMDKEALNQYFAEMVLEADKLKIEQASDFYALIFRYGIGYIIIEMELSIENDMILERGMLFNNILARNGKKLFNEFLMTHEKFLQEATCLAERKRKDTANHSKKPDNPFIPWAPRALSECLVFTASVIDRYTFRLSEAKEVLYKLSGAMRWDEPFARTRYYERIADEGILELRKDVFYSFAKTGGALLLLQDDYNKTLEISKREQIKKRQEAVVKNFYQNDFWSFLLALHQQHILMRFSNDLAVYTNGNNKKKIAELRHLLLEFTTSGWFSQVSHNQTSIEVYRRWQYTFENDSLYREVFDELAAVDDYISMKRTRHIEIITAAMLPLVVLATLFGVNFAEIQDLQLLPWWALGISLTLALIWVLWYWFSLRN